MEEIERSGGENPGAALMNALDQAKWTDPEQQAQVARRIRQLWEQGGRWMPDFQGTNKQKVKQRDRCRKVREWVREP